MKTARHKGQRVTSILEEDGVVTGEDDSGDVIELVRNADEYSLVCVGEVTIDSGVRIRVCISTEVDVGVLLSNACRLGAMVLTSILRRRRVSTRSRC